MHSVRMAYILWLPSLFGFSGLHRFYLGKFGTGLLFLFTGGLFGLGTLYDAFTLPDQVREARLKARYSAALEASDREFLRRLGIETSAGPSSTNSRETVEHVILRTAKKNRGIATPAEVALEGGISTDQAKEHLESLVSKGVAEVRVRSSSGTLVYVLPDFLDPEADASLESF